MTTTTPAPPASAPTPTPPRRTSATVVAVIAIALGAVLVVGAVTTALFAALRSGAVRTETFSADAAGLTGFDVDVSGADLEIVYGDTDEVQLTVEGTPADWRLDRDGDELSIRTDRGWFGRWGFGSEDGDQAILTLPVSLERRGLDAALSLAAGSISAEGSFGELELDLSAGAIDVAGTARDLDVDVSAGRATLDLTDVDSADLRVSAGALEGRLTGSAPTETTVDVAAGRVDLGLPDAPYRVTTDVSAGEFDNRLDTSPTARSHVAVSVSAGGVVLRPVR